MSKQYIERQRVIYIGLTFFTIVVGLLSRKYYYYLPSALNLYLGDALYALMMFWILGFLFNRQNIVRNGFMAMIICYTIEFTQTLDYVWLIKIRSNILGKLILGTGFLWSDLLAYVLGILVGGLMETIVYRKRLL